MRSKRFVLVSPIILCVIVFVGFAVRFYQLPKVPLANRDELAIGYNAYSILKTGRDEYGVKWPVNFRSFGDYKLPGLIYTTAGSMALFGRSLFSVRFSDALFGTLTLIIAYQLAQDLFHNQIISLATSGFLATAPWHIHGSRSAYEPIVGLFWSVLSYLLLIRSRKAHWFYLVGFICTSFIGAFFYNAPFILLPGIYLLFILLKCFVDHELPKRFIIVGLLLIVAMGGYWRLFNTVGLSKTNTTIFSVSSLQNKPFELSKSLAQDAYPFLIVRLSQFPDLYQLVSVVRGYVSAFNPVYIWFDGGDNAWHNLRSIYSGNMNLFTLPLVFIGTAWMISSLRKKRPFNSLFVLGLLLLTPLADAITIDAPNTNRLMEFHFVLIVLAAYGFSVLLRFKKNFLTLSFIGIYCLSVILFTGLYFSVLQDSTNGTWNAHFDQFIPTILSLSSHYQTIFVNLPGEYGYIYMAFFTPFDPHDFQMHAQRQMDGMNQAKQYLNYKFSQTVKQGNNACGSVLQVTAAEPGDDQRPFVAMMRNRFGEPIWKAEAVDLNYLY